jgi:hypothetical protein
LELIENVFSKRSAFPVLVREKEKVYAIQVSGDVHLDGQYVSRKNLSIALANLAYELRLIYRFKKKLQINNADSLFGKMNEQPDIVHVQDNLNRIFQINAYGKTKLHSTKIKQSQLPKEIRRLRKEREDDLNCSSS